MRHWDIKMLAAVLSTIALANCTPNGDTNGSPDGSSPDGGSGVAVLCVATTSGVFKESHGCIGNLGNGGATENMSFGIWGAEGVHSLGNFQFAWRVQGTFSAKPYSWSDVVSGGQATFLAQISPGTMGYGSGSWVCGVGVGSTTPCPGFTLSLSSVGPEPALNGLNNFGGPPPIPSSDTTTHGTLDVTLPGQALGSGNNMLPAPANLVMHIAF